MMIFDGHIVDVGEIGHGRGVAIQLSTTQTIEIIGMTEHQTREEAVCFITESA